MSRSKKVALANDELAEEGKNPMWNDDKIMFEFRTAAPTHDPYGLYRRLLQNHAEAMCELLTKRLIRKCQSEVIGLKSETGLKNLWEEICVSLREDSYFSSLYEDHLESRMTSLVDALPTIERQILWLMTYDGVEYATNPEWPHPQMLLEDDLPLDTKPDEPWPSTNPDEWPVDSRKIARDVIHDYVMDEVSTYENARIRAYTEE